MSKFTNPLNNIKIAWPCNADWNEMVGDERTRFCGECKLNVYNLSGMSQREAENLLINSEGRLCVRFYKRADGAVLTKDCPVGWKAIKQRISKTATAFASLVFATFSGIGLANYFSKPSESQIMGAMAPKVEFIGANEIIIEDVNASAAVQEIPFTTMGKIAISNDKQYTLSRGGMSNLEAVRSQIKQQRKR
jgi:hypothetical protein